MTTTKEKKKEILNSVMEEKSEELKIENASIQEESVKGNPLENVYAAQPYERRHCKEDRIVKLNKHAASALRKYKRASKHQFQVEDIDLRFVCKLARDPVLEVNFSDKKGSALHYLINRKRTKEALLLLDHPICAKALAVVKDGRKETALHRCAWNDDSLVALRLIELGADVNKKNKRGKSPLHLAASRSAEGVAEVLIEAGANVNAVDHAGDTPLHRAFAKLSVDMCSLLICNGADTSIVNKTGKTSLPPDLNLSLNKFNYGQASEPRRSFFTSPKDDSLDVPRTKDPSQKKKQKKTHSDGSGEAHSDEEEQEEDDDEEEDEEEEEEEEERKGRNSHGRPGVSNRPDNLIRQAINRHREEKALRKRDRRERKAEAPASAEDGADQGGIHQQLKRKTRRLKTKMQGAFYQEKRKESSLKITIPGTNEVVSLSKYWSWEELKYICHSVFRPLSVVDPKLKKAGHRGLRCRRLSRDACIQAWGQDIDPLIVACLFERASPNSGGLALLDEIVPYLCVITRGSKEERLHLTLMLLDQERDGLLRQSELANAFAAIWRSPMRSPRLDLGDLMGRAQNLIFDIDAPEPKENEKNPSDESKKSEIAAKFAAAAELSKQKNQGNMDMFKAVQLARAASKFRKLVKQNPEEFSEWQIESSQQKTNVLRRSVMKKKLDEDSDDSDDDDDDDESDDGDSTEISSQEEDDENDSESNSKSHKLLENQSAASDIKNSTPLISAVDENSGAEDTLSGNSKPSSISSASAAVPPSTTLWDELAYASSSSSDSATDTSYSMYESDSVATVSEEGDHSRGGAKSNAKSGTTTCSSTDSEDMDALTRMVRKRRREQKRRRSLEKSTFHDDDDLLFVDHHAKAEDDDDGVAWSFREKHKAPALQKHRLHQQRVKKGKDSVSVKPFSLSKNSKKSQSTPDLNLNSKNASMPDDGGTSLNSNDRVTNGTFAKNLDVMKKFQTEATLSISSGKLSAAASTKECIEEGLWFLNPIPGARDPIRDFDQVREALSHDQEVYDEFCGLFGIMDAFGKEILRAQSIESNLKTGKSGRLLFSEKKKKKKRFRLVFARLEGGTLTLFRQENDSTPMITIFLHEYSLKIVNPLLREWILRSPDATYRFSCNSSKGFRTWTRALLIITCEKLDNPFHSFSPVRRKTACEWYVCGKQYYSALYSALKKAKRFVYISDWFLSPEIYLKRGPKSKRKHCLKEVLLHIAERGVQVRILIWKETKIAVSLQNYRAASLLGDLHPNIQAIVHPPKFPMNWTHHQKLVCIDQSIAFIGGLDLCFGRYDDINYRLVDDAHCNLTWPGKDFYNPRLAGISNTHEPYLDALDRTTCPRMPWQDVMVRVNGGAAFDVSRNFIERWNHHRGVTDDILSLQSASGEIENEEGTCNVQVLRSIGSWSGGTRVERSIYEAYLSAIRHAQHYIYIENQYFISSTAGSGIQNKIAEALIERIARAHKEKTTFRVFIVIPCHPEGNLKDEYSLVYIMKWQYLTINRGGSSIFEQLNKKHNISEKEIFNYISICCLRQHGFMNEKPITEQIYVHTKLMIVDDRVVIVGSANINDRSMLGIRDSEIAVMIEDEEMVPSVMGGKPYMAGKFAYGLRYYLWRVHLGFLSPVLDLNMDMPRDPISDAVFHGLWRRIASTNTHIYDTVFSGIPSNRYTTVSGMSRGYKKYGTVRTKGTGTGYLANAWNTFARNRPNASSLLNISKSELLKLPEWKDGDEASDELSKSAPVLIKSENQRLNACVQRLFDIERRVSFSCGSNDNKKSSRKRRRRKNRTSTPIHQQSQGKPKGNGKMTPRKESPLESAVSVVREKSNKLPMENVPFSSSPHSKSERTVNLDSLGVKSTSFASMMTSPLVKMQMATSSIKKRNTVQDETEMLKPELDSHLQTRASPANVDGNPEEVKDLLEGVCGNLCEFPLNFLKHSKITSITYSVVVGADVFQ